MSFDGDEYITFDQQILTNETTEFTYSVFFNAYSSNTQTLLNVGDEFGGVRLRIIDSKLVLVHNNISELHEPVEFNLNDWIHFGATYNNGNLKIYLNGNIEYEGSYTYNNSANFTFENNVAQWPVLFGAIYNDVYNSTVQQFYNGSIR